MRTRNLPASVSSQVHVILPPPPPLPSPSPMLASVRHVWRFTQKRFGACPWIGRRVYPDSTDAHLGESYALGGVGLVLDELAEEERLELIALIRLPRGRVEEQGQGPREEELLARVPRGLWLPPLDLDVDTDHSDYDPLNTPQMASDLRELIAEKMPEHGLGSAIWYQTNKHGGAHGMLDVSRLQPHPDITRRLIPALVALAADVGISTTKGGSAIKLDISLFQHFPDKRGRMWRLPGSQKETGAVAKTLILPHGTYAPVAPEALADPEPPQPPQAKKAFRVSKAPPTTDPGPLTENELATVLSVPAAAREWRATDTTDASKRDCRFLAALLHADVSDELALKAVYAMPAGKAATRRQGERSYLNSLERWMARVLADREPRNWPRTLCCPCCKGRCRVRPDGQAVYCYGRRDEAGRRGVRIEIPRALHVPRARLTPAGTPPEEQYRRPDPKRRNLHLYGVVGDDAKRAAGAQRSYRRQASCGRSLLEIICENFKVHPGIRPICGPRRWLMCGTRFCCRCVTRKNQDLEVMRALVYDQQVGSDLRMLVLYQPRRSSGFVGLHADFQNLLADWRDIFVSARGTKQLGWAYQVAEQLEDGTYVPALAWVQTATAHRRIADAARAAGYVVREERIRDASMAASLVSQLLANVPFLPRDDDERYVAHAALWNKRCVRTYGGAQSVENLRGEKLIEAQFEFGLSVPEQDEPTCPTCGSERTDPKFFVLRMQHEDGTIVSLSMNSPRPDLRDPRVVDEVLAHLTASPVPSSHPPG